MRNGNVPVALQRWEYLGRDDAVLRPDVYGDDPVTPVPRWGFYCPIEKGRTVIDAQETIYKNAA
jgi:hypothetical protein